ncbi:MAG: methyltransferase domain-containing protein [Planctomycetes bacterium]|nr:methyltransferase domain-containing protein [Planctomycetota bacterium]
MADQLPLPDFLASLGKTELKPGGSYATGAAIRMLDLSSGERVLVLGPNAANTALFVSMTTQTLTEALVKEESEKVTEGDPALKRRSTARIGKIEDLPFEDGQFDAVLVEATLSYQTEDRQLQTLKGIARVLKPGGRIALHELAWRQPPTPEVERRLAEIWQGPVNPGVVRAWWNLLEQNGFGDIRNELAVISYFTPSGMTADEGETAVDIFHKAFASEETLDRFYAAYRELAENRRYYGVILATASKA